MIVEYRIICFDEEIVCIRDEHQGDGFVYSEALYSGLVDVEDQAAVRELFDFCMMWAESDYGATLPWVTPPDVGVSFVESAWLARTTELVRP